MESAPSLLVSYFSKEEKDRVLGSQEVINFLITKFSQVNFASQDNLEDVLLL